MIKKIKLHIIAIILTLLTMTIYDWSYDYGYKIAKKDEFEMMKENIESNEDITQEEQETLDNMTIDEFEFGGYSHVTHIFLLILTIISIIVISVIGFHMLFAT